MEKKEITLQMIFDTMITKFDQIDSKFDKIDKRLDSMDERFDGIDKRITVMDYENKEAHSNIAKEMQFMSNTLTLIEKNISEKFGILFDAEKANRERMFLFGNQQLRFQDELDNYKFRLSNLERSKSQKL